MPRPRPRPPVMGAGGGLCPNGGGVRPGRRGGGGTTLNGGGFRSDVEVSFFDSTGDSAPRPWWEPRREPRGKPRSSKELAEYIEYPSRVEVKDALE